MKTPVSYYGGKQKMVQNIVPLIAKHKIYVEPFFGTGAIYFAKEPSEVEFINDINGEVINFFEQCKTNFKELSRRIKETECYTRIYHRKAGIIYKNPECFSAVERAWAFWIQSNFSFSAKITGGWAYAIQKQDPIKLFINRRKDFSKIIQERLSHTYIENKDALKVIDATDSPETFFYIDPPYLNSNQGHYSGYRETAFEDLLKRLSGVQGKFILSSYPHPLVRKYVRENKWSYQEIEKNLCAGKAAIRTGRKKTECLTFNYK